MAALRFIANRQMPDRPATPHQLSRVGSSCDGLDLRCALKGTVNRTAIRDFKKAGALIPVQIPIQKDHPLELVGLASTGGIGILRMHLVMAHIDPHMIKRPALAAGIHADRHRGAGP